MSFFCHSKIILLTLVVLFAGFASGCGESKLNEAYAKLHNTEKQRDDSNAKLTDANAKLLDANTKLTNANAKLHSMQSDLDDANAILRSTQRRLREAQSDDSQPEVHCRLGWAPPDPGTDTRAWARIDNDEDTTASLNIVVTRKDGIQKEKDAVVVTAHGSTILTIDGWTFITGDTLTLNEFGHKAGTWTVPAP